MRIPDSISDLDSSGRSREVLSSGLRTQVISIKSVSKIDMRVTSRLKYSAQLWSMEQYW